MKRSFILIAALLFTLQIGAETSYKWTSLLVGGGGYITGMVAHPSEENLMYIRTDVGGVYRYEAPNDEHPDNPYWVQLMEWITVDDVSLWSADGIALNPQNTDEIYVALGSGAGDSWMDYDPYPQGVYKSTDRGATWTQVLEKRFRGNQGNRSTGECIAVIPEGDGEIVLVGTRIQGLFRSEDSGANWSEVTSVPADANGVGIRSIAFDPSNPSNVYLTAYNYGVYASTDKGETFTLIDGTSAIYPRCVAVASNGNVWISSTKGVYRYTGGELVKNSPSSSVSDYNGITIDPNNPNHLVISQLLSGYNTKLYRTTDDGDSWSTITSNKTFFNNVPWYTDDHMGASIAGVVINPFNSDEFWFTDWYLPWKTDDVSADGVYFESVPWGVEELVIFDITSPPTDAILYNGCADNGGLRHESMTEYPTIKFSEQESTGLDFCEVNPASVVRVSSRGFGASSFRISRSDDAGETWRTVYSPDDKTGKVAYSAKNTENYIFIPTGSTQIPLVTKDDGESWVEVNGLPADTYNKEFWNNYNRALISDRVNGNKYYAMIDGKCYVSEDGGSNFSVKATGISQPSSSATPELYMVASPYAEGELWLSVGGKGLYHSTDSGNSFSSISGFSDCKIVTVGPPITGTTPIVYTHAKHSTTGWGVFRSLDGGSSWTQINDSTCQVSNKPRQMAADRSYPGRVFIGTNGRGIYAAIPPEITTQVATPMITPTMGVVYTETMVTIKSLPEDAEIYYTTDGSEPTTSSTRYTSPFMVDQITQVKAIAVQAGLTNSDVSEAIYQNVGAAGIGTTQMDNAVIGVSYQDESRVLLSGTDDVLSYSILNASGTYLVRNSTSIGSEIAINTSNYNSQLLIVELLMNDQRKQFIKIVSL